MHSFPHTYIRRATNIVSLAVAAGVLWFGFFASYAFAAYPIEQIPGGEQVFGDFVVGPTKVEVSVEPGQSQQVELMVTNRMGERRQFHLGIEDIKGSNDPAQTVVLLGDDRGPYSLKDYIHFSESSFELGQGERARIPVTISIPADAQPGGLYGSVLVTTTSLPNKDDQAAIKAGTKGNSVIISRIGALFFVTVPGAVERAGHLQKFATVPEGHTLWSEGPIRFQILFENTGSVHLNPSATLSIKNMLGEEVGSVATDPWYAFPQSVRMREVTWSRQHLFGKYTATLSLNRGYDNETDTASVVFYVIPWTLIGEVFVGLVALFLFLRFIIRSFEIKRK